MAKTSWQQQRERGSALGIGILFATARLLGRPAARFVLAFVTLYFLLTAGAARRASRQYLRRALGRAPGWRDLWRHFWCFSGCALDRVFLLAGGKEIEVRIELADEVLAIGQRGGALLMVSHFGSFEAMRTSGIRQAEIPLAILMDRAHGARITRALERVAPDFSAQVIDADQPGPSLVLKLRETLAAGKLVGMMVDRARTGEATGSVDFLGAPARFPLGPWQLAVALRCPVILGYAVPCGGRKYLARFELFSPGLEAARGQRGELAREAMQRYSEWLARQARSAPYNWFNFYDFWAE